MATKFETKWAIPRAKNMTIILASDGGAS